MKVNGKFYFDPDDPIYSDHFPGNPVVPGSLVIHAFLKAAARMLTATSPVTVENFRFKKFLRPGKYDFQLQKISSRDEIMTLNCRLLAAEEVVVTGRLRQCS